MSTFDADTLQALRTVREVTIRTGKQRNAAVIWVTVSDDEVFVRSWRGADGRWYKAVASGGPAMLEFDRRRLAVRAIPVGDAESVARASREYLRKYKGSSHAREMVRTEILPTTLRLEPG